MIILRFNPTLVRLRPFFFGNQTRGGKQFQSHAGSIEAAGGFDSHPGEWPFQSHAGSIEAFEKKKVDLGYPLFQSHPGSIEAWGASGLGYPHRETFQSHAGSIEAREFILFVLRESGVSIPRWFD